MKANVAQTENLKLRRLVQRELGADFEQLGENDAWRGRAEQLEVQRV